MLFLGFLLVLAGEIVSFVLVGEQIGFLWTLVLLIGASALGPFVVRRVGLGVLSSTRTRLLHGEVPTRELLDGLVVLIAGVMICVPGFIGDALGLLMMIGPVRHFVIRMSGRRLARRVQRATGRRWRVIDVSPRTSGEHQPPSGPAALPLGPGSKS